MPPNPAHKQLEKIVERCVNLQAAIPVDEEPPTWIVASLKRLDAKFVDYEAEIVAALADPTPQDSDSASAIPPAAAGAATIEGVKP